MLLLFGIIIIVVVIIQSEFFQVHKLILLIYLRGLMSPNRFWWKISELIHNDLAGAKLFQQFKDETERDGLRKFKLVWTLGRSYHLVLDVTHVREILDNSPWIFGVGSLKYDFFKSFISELQSTFLQLLLTLFFFT